MESRLEILCSSGSGFLALGEVQAVFLHLLCVHSLKEQPKPREEGCVTFRISQATAPVEELGHNKKSEQCFVYYCRCIPKSEIRKATPYMPHGGVSSDEAQGILFESLTVEPSTRNSHRDSTTADSTTFGDTRATHSCRLKYWRLKRWRERFKPNHLLERQVRSGTLVLRVSGLFTQMPGSSPIESSTAGQVLDSELVGALHRA